MSVVDRFLLVILAALTKGEPTTEVVRFGGLYGDANEENLRASCARFFACDGNDEVSVTVRVPKGVLKDSGKEEKERTYSGAAKNLDHLLEIHASVSKEGHSIMSVAKKKSD